jgi:phenylalanyl-tRNA synthetase beta subunit
MIEAGLASGYARLEALEEIDRLRGMGMSDNEIEDTLTGMGISAQLYKQITRVTSP